MELYYHSVDEDILILSADGGLDAETAHGLVDDLEKLVKAGARKLVIDCSKLDFISSAAISVLIRLHKKLAARGGDAKLAAVDSRIIRLLELTGLTRVFHIYNNVDEAREAFRA